ncbi:ankyrin repeat-containing domain protein [Trichoderma chlorosporum]
MLLTLRIISTDVSMDTSSNKQSISGNAEDLLSGASTDHRTLDWNDDPMEKSSSNEEDEEDESYDSFSQDAVPNYEQFATWDYLPLNSSDPLADDAFRKAVENGAFQPHLADEPDVTTIGPGRIINNYYAAGLGLDNTRDEILQRLYTSPYFQRKHRNPDRVPGTCEWFTKHDNFHEWLENSSSSMLWVSANPGCGKSVLAKYLVDEFRTTGPRTTCYFFFKEDFDDQRSAQSALSCILHQLFTQRGDLFSAKIIKRFESFKTPVTPFYYELWELWDILIMAAQEKDAGEIICILDALDECADNQRKDLSKIISDFYGPNGEIKRKANLKFLITSRPYNTIQRDLFNRLDITECPVIHLKGEGDVEIKMIAEEINLYIKHKISRLDLTAREEIILLQGLRAVHNQTYLWVYLTLEWIETEINSKTNENEIRGFIRTLPRTVDEAYDKILSKSTDLEETKKLLHIVVAAERPLTLPEMDLALAVQQHHKSYEDLGPRTPSDRVSKYIRDLCGLFINITDGKIHLLHQTAKEFLVSKDNVNSWQTSLRQGKDGSPAGRQSYLTWKFSLKPSDSHTILFNICIWNLLFMELETHPLTEEENVAGYLTIRPFLQYSATYWSAHFRASNIKENEVIKQLQQIFNAKSARFLTWFKVYWAYMNPDLDFPSDFTTLIAASYLGIKSIVRLQLRSPDVQIDFVDSIYGRSALSWASEKGFEGVVKLLIKGPELQLRTAFKRAIGRSSLRGAKIDITDKVKRTPLSYASWNGHLSVVQMLIEAGARADLKDEIGGTPIAYALCTGQQDIVAELVKGSEVQPTVKHGQKPIIKRLLDIGVNIEEASKDGMTPLITAIENGYEAIVKLLLDSGADLEAMGETKNTPLIIAVMNGHEPIVKLLLDFGADPEKAGKDRKRPIIIAAERGYERIVTLLLEVGVDLI